MYSKLPKSITLDNDKVAIIRKLNQGDKKSLYEFFQKLPSHDRMFLKDDVTDKKVIDKWFENLDFKNVIPIVVECDNKIIADGTLHRSEHGWTRHIGEIRMVVDKEFRKQSVGLHLVRELYFIAMNLKLEILVAEMLESQKQAINIFKQLGFKREALLKNFVKDLAGIRQNLIIMTHTVSIHWEELENFVADFHADFSGDFG